MKTLKLKGFSLIECIVALALIGITSMLIAQVYGSVALMNKNNARLNTSLTEQMRMAEKEIKDDQYYAGGSSEITKVEKVELNSYAGSGVPNPNSVDKIQFKVIPNADSVGDNNDKFVTGSSSKPLDCDIDVFVLKAKDKVTDSGKTYAMDQDVRYKFILPAQHK